MECIMEIGFWGTFHDFPAALCRKNAGLQNAWRSCGRHKLSNRQRKLIQWLCTIPTPYRGIYTELVLVIKCAQ